MNTTAVSGRSRLSMAWAHYPKKALACDEVKAQGSNLHPVAYGRRVADLAD
jgi:hypothetical protein